MACLTGVREDTGSGGNAGLLAWPGLLAVTSQIGPPVIFTAMEAARSRSVTGLVLLLTSVVPFYLTLPLFGGWLPAYASARFGDLSWCARQLAPIALVRSIA